MESGRAKKVKIPTSSAVVKAIAEGAITFATDPDFGYEIATAVPGIDDAEFLQPRSLYERQGRLAEYTEHVERLKKERAEFLGTFPALGREIVDAVT